ncbi:MAG: hypothetical protein ACJ783_03090 [Myxococcales bacterium]
MKRRLSAAFLALSLVGAARGALAQGTGPDAPRPPPPRADSAAGARLDRPVRVRASHRVDVIAPGERVETIIDRMRSTRPVTPPADVKPVDRPPPPRAADRGREREREREDSRSDAAQHGSGGGPRAAPAGSGSGGSDRTHR